MTIKISVCIPTHNRAKYVGRAIRSLIDQSFNRSFYEIIVVDDGSNDSTEIALNAFEKDIVLIKNKKQEGLSRSLNKAILRSKGKYFLRVDSDDYVNHDYLKFLFLMIDLNNDVDAVSCDYLLVDDKENVLKRVNCETEPIGCGIIFRLDQLKDLGMYSANIKIYEEIDLMKRFDNSKLKKIRLPLPLYRYRIHENNMTKNAKL